MARKSIMSQENVTQGSQQRRKRGTVGVESRPDRGLRLRWTYQGKPYCLALGIPDTKAGMALAQQKAVQIELDMAAGHFDVTLDRYRPQDPVHPRPDDLTKKIRGRLEKRHDPSEEALLKHLQEWGKPIRDPGDAESFVGFMRFVKKLKPSTIQRRLNILKAVDPANFKGIKAGTEIQGIPTGFTPQQVHLILDFLKGSSHYGHYHDLIAFYFLTGCRVSEALALEWRHIDFQGRVIHFVQSLGSHRDGSVFVKTTKTGKGRAFPMNATLTQLLMERYKSQGSPSPEGLVFPAKHGGYISRRNLSGRCWRACLVAAGIPYDPRKSCLMKSRHSVISWGLQAGIPVANMAAMAGHSTRTMHNKYQSIIERTELPDFLMGGQ